MNLISCPGCGVVYNAELLHFPTEVYEHYPDGSVEIDDTKAVWIDKYKDYFPKIDCRVCGTAIPMYIRRDY